MKEVWRTVPSFGRVFSASSKGRIRTKPRLVRFVSKAGNEAYRRKKGKILSPQKQNGGYLLVHLHLDDKRVAKTVHSLVIEAFKGKRPRGLDVRHYNGRRTDNRPSNLSYSTRSKNLKDMIRHGTCPFTGAKVTAAQVRKIRGLRGDYPAVLVARKFGLKSKQVYRIWSRENWKHVT